MDLADERQEEINMLEKKITYLQNQLTECAEFERTLIMERDTMKERIETDFETIKQMTEALAQS